MKIRSIDIVRDYKKVLWLSVAAIVVFKCILMGLFSSDYQDKMFIPLPPLDEQRRIARRIEELLSLINGL